MSSGTSILTRLSERVFPRMPDFYALINDQCDVCVEALGAFTEFLQAPAPGKAARVLELEHQGDELKARNSEILDRAFATPMDREDILRAIVGIDQVVNYAKATVTELEILALEPDVHMLEIGALLKGGAEALREGYRQLTTDPHAAEAASHAVRKAERGTEKVYRAAIADLFRIDELARSLEANEHGAGARALTTVIDILKRREIYRHMSNWADRLAHAGDELHDIAVKIS
ncbi:MAG: DUF47 family protein [Gemmatimonadota bacterium]